MWIARDKDGELYAYASRPVRFKEYFGCPTDWRTWDGGFLLDKDQYPEVTWENSPKELVVKEDNA